MKLSIYLVSALAAIAFVGTSAAVDVTINDSEAPDIRNFLERSKQTVQKYWDDTARYLATSGFSPPRAIKLVAKAEYGPPAAAGGDTIYYSAKYARANTNDMGMSVHELTHLIQAYRECPGWLTEGIADYVRYFRNSISPDRRPGKPGNEDKGWERGYGTTAYFLNWTQRNKNRNLVPELNKACRNGKYSDNIWNTLTRQTVKQNWDEMQRRA